MTVLEVLPFCVNGANDGTFLVLTLCWCEFTNRVRNGDAGLSRIRDLAFLG